jgi:NADPH-dependent 2,4-dienoyl-CoA reductase/sulfur reductase-like enzyme
MEKEKKYICLGSSAASLSCAHHIKRLEPQAQVTLLTAQHELPNNTCLLADYVAGKRSKESLYLPIPEGVEIHYNAEVVSIDTKLKKIITCDGKEFFYDKLFIGTGLSARIPEMFLPELYKKVFPYKTLDDIFRFEQAQISGKNVLVAGGGVTGIESAHALTVRGYQVTLIEKDSRLLSKFNQEFCQEILELLQINGVTVKLNYQVSFDDINQFDAVFLATGGIPVTDFIKNQLELENGFIVVDEDQRTSCKDICAGGDICAGRSLWPQAVRDGIIAAYSILNHPTPVFKKPSYKTVLNLFGKRFFL